MRAHMPTLGDQGHGTRGVAYEHFANHHDETNRHNPLDFALVILDLAVASEITGTI